MNASINGFEMYYELHGEGEPLLWLHGFGGCGTDWKYIFNEPPAGYRLIAPDLRGHGLSTNAGNEWTFAQSAQDVLTLLDQLGLQRVNAIGLSGGGITLLHLAIVAPQLVERIIPVSAPPYFPDQARAIQRQFSHAMLTPQQLEIMRASHKRGAGQLDWIFAQSRAFAESREDVSPQLGLITAQTLIVFGDRDPFYPVALAFEMKQVIRNSYLWVVPNGGHGPVFGPDARRFSETALAFLGGAWKPRSRA
jgi:pimeloyl-ACP methyl ester carboxylesterase